MSNNNDIKTVEELANMDVDASEAPDPSENPEAYRDPREEPVVSGPSEADVKEIGAVGDDHPLVKETGSEALETQTESGAGEFLSDFIYEHDSAWVREWLQNEETACVRAAKLLIKMSDEYADGWLTHEMWVNSETGDTVIDYDEDQSALAEFDVDGDVRRIEIPRPIDEVLEAARTLGYDPTIVWDVKLDEREIVTEDNGIGMTSKEFDEAFNTIFNSGSGVDGETGGMFGVGSESSALVHGNDGGAEVETRSRRPTRDGDGHEGFRAYSYLGGANALPGEVEENFRGTRFIIPVQESFDLNNLQGWVEDYAEKLRVPLLYREHDAGSNPVEEEYEATAFLDDYDDPPVSVNRPGEFSVVGGPDVVETGYHVDNDEDTFLVSMPIDRNTSVSINTLWDVAIQIHDEQGLIIAGPNRGEHRKDVDSLHDDDIVLPEPTGDRDRLQKDSKSKAFFNYVQDVVKAEELKEVGEIADEMKEADHPAEAIQNNRSDWYLFVSMVKYHGHYNVLDQERKFKELVNDRDEFPDFDDETMSQVYGLFQKVEHCHRGAGSSSQKSSRSQKRLGELLSKNESTTVYMAASTGGNFTDYFRVVENTHDDAEVIVVDNASKYQTWSRRFGFDILNKVPLTQSDDDNDHDFDVPDSVHQRKLKKNKSRGGKPDSVLDRALKIRNSGDNSSIDSRISISDAQDKLANGKTFGNHSKLVLFPRSAEENISDHYGLAEYAAIASVSKKEYSALSGYDDVMTYSEYVDWSASALIATEDGAMTPAELIEDERMVILAYRPVGNHKVVKLLSDEHEELRQHYAEDVRDQLSWSKLLNGFDGGYGGIHKQRVHDDAKPDTLFAVAGPIVLNRAEHAFSELWDNTGFGNQDMMGLRTNGQRYGYDNPCSWVRLDGKTTTYRLMVDTPNWDNSSDIYEIMPSNHYNRKAQMYLGFHDMGVDPSEESARDLREMMN